MNCCENCFSESEISKYIHKNGKKGICDFCNSKSTKIISLDKVGSFIKTGLRKSYETLDDGTGAMWDSEDGMYVGSRGTEVGQSIHEILMDIESVFSPNMSFEQQEKLLTSIFEESKEQCDDGESHDFDDIYDPYYVLQSDLYGVEIVDEHIAWEQFVYQTKFFNRFFDVNINIESRKQLLKSLSSVFKYLEEYIEKDSILFRVRQIDIENINSMNNESLYKEISPAPNLLSQNNRMSPKGISYMYLSDNISTCCYEAKVEKNKNGLLGTFTPKKRLRILARLGLPVVA